MFQFDTLSQDLTGDAREILRRLLEKPRLTQDELLNRIDVHRQEVRVAAEQNPLVNLALSEQLADTLVALLGRLHEGTPPQLHELVQGAVLYYADDDDADVDVATAFGFDDDLLVIRAIEQAIDAA